jgi:3-hydroxyisobutyrate dehydrogenase-like beta-hydroxyacid dehydrogenase
MISFLGLGTMGAPMSLNLLKQHPDLVVWNRSPEPRQQLIAAGASEAESAKQALSAEVSFSMFSNDAAVDAVLSSENIAPNTVHICMASISPELARTLTQRFAEAGAKYISAPVLGRPNIAAAGMLNILAAGDPAEISKHEKTMLAMGKRVWPIGVQPEKANLVKIAVNYNILHAIQALAESVALVESHDVNGEEFVNILTGTLFDGVVYRGYGEQVAIRNFDPVLFSMDLGRKDLALAEQAANEAGIKLPSTDVLAKLLDTALETPELTDKDWAAVSDLTLNQDK